MTEFRDEMTLAEARNALRPLLEDGHRCPLCTQMAKIYRRKINSTMARTAIKLYKVQGQTTNFVHGPSLPGDTHEISQLAWWALVEEERILRPDGGRAGYWRLTYNGRAFVRDLMAVPKYAHVYDGRRLRLDGEGVRIREALGTRFNYAELMEGI